VIVPIIGPKSKSLLFPAKPALTIPRFILDVGGERYLCLRAWSLITHLKSQRELSVVYKWYDLPAFIVERSASSFEEMIMNMCWDYMKSLARNRFRPEGYFLLSRQQAIQLGLVAFP